MKRQLVWPLAVLSTVSSLLLSPSATAIAVDIDRMELPFFVDEPAVRPTPPAGTPSPASSAISVNLSASTTSASANQPVTLTWNATNASSCRATGNWTGALPTRGTRTVGYLRKKSTYGILCSGAGGTAISFTSVDLVSAHRLSWTPPRRNRDGTPLTDLAGYRIYWGTSPRNYTAHQALKNPRQLAQGISLTSGTYYFAMTALDDAGNESALSNEVTRVFP